MDWGRGGRVAGASFRGVVLVRSVNRNGTGKLDLAQLLLVEMMELLS